MKTNLNRTSNSTAAVGVVFHLVDGTIQSCNVEAENILGYTAEQLIGASSFELPWQTIYQEGSPFPPQTHPAIASIKTGQPGSNIIMGFYKPDGDLVWLSIDSLPLFKANNTELYGVEVSFVNLTKDIETRIRTKALGREQYISDCIKKRLHDRVPLGLPQAPTREELVELIPGIIYVYDAIAYRNVYINSQVYDALGYTPQEISELEPDFMAQVMHPDDFARFPTQISSLDSSKQGEISKFQYRMRHKNGEWRWFSSQDRVYSRTVDGSVQQIVGIARDITNRRQTEIALRESEERLKLATDASGIGMWFWNLAENTLEWTELGKAIFGRSLDDDLSYETFFDLLHPEDRDRTEDAVYEALANQTEYCIEYRVVWSDDSVRWILAKGRGFYDRDGEAIRMMGTVQDITAQKESEQRLKENEELLRLALFNAKAGTWDWDLIRDRVVWSSENYELYGIDPEIKPLHYQDWEYTLHPDDIETSNLEIEKVLSGETAEFKTEFRIIHPTAGIRWVLGIGNVTRNENGEPIRLSGLNLNISDLKETELALRQSKQQLRILLDSLPIFAGFLTTEGKVFEVNQTALDVANLQPEDVLEKDFRETYWWSYSPEIQSQIDNAIKRAAAGETVRFDIIAKAKDRNFIVTDFGIVPKFNSQGQVEYLVPFGMNVSDREAAKQALKQREQELRLIIEVIPQQIWTALPNGETDYFNQRWQEYTGLNLKQGRKRGWKNIVHPDDLQEVSEKWTQAVEYGSNYNIEARLRRTDGKYHWFLVKARPLRNSRGEIIKWYGTNTGITRIKELEQKLLQQTEDLTNANRLKDEFLAIVSHELRTPLNPILGWSQLLAAGRLNAEKTAVGIKIIGRNAKLQTQLIDDLLDVSRILRGKLNLDQNILNLESIIRSALTTVNLSAEAKSIQIETIYEANILQVLGDAGRLQQIVWNLVSNAIKFTPEGGRIIIKLKRVGSQGQIQIEDTGQGIDAEFLPYVFDRFRQAEGSNTRQYGGLGLGLAIARHLTELHGGTVTVSSPGKGKGATFSVKLPLMNAATSEQTEIEIDSNLIDRSARPNRFSGVEILVVDDEPDSLDILTLVLEQEGAEVRSVTSAKEALVAFNQSTPDLIISDLGMPEANGYTLITHIRARFQGKNVPAIALTAYAGETDKQRTLDAGYQKHLAKPINISELIAAIEQLIQWRC